jgi:hypothetical protein
MNRAMLENHLAAAERHLTEAERQVVRQRELVAELERDGHDSGQAIHLLEQFEEVLTIRIAYRDRLRAELGS